MGIFVFGLKLYLLVLKGVNLCSMQKIPDRRMQNISFSCNCSSTCRREIGNLLQHGAFHFRSTQRDSPASDHSELKVPISHSNRPIMVKVL
ncbi:hypothetical protein NPIL_501581 [Nephila pilipes]|uniref:Uncharacterized protein n=1 Tax=Nephila pilipes TaxID=299642 RepID=A0A8X6T6L6_NEPPI|nr:hypothetical protein NPIL_501581 [Nephila pilipes]